MFSLIGIIGAIIFGAIIGALARLIMPGKQNISVLWTIVLGTVGVFIGSLIANSFGIADTSSGEVIKWGLAIVIAIITTILEIFIYLGITGRK